MHIRRAFPTDLAEITRLFYETVTRINAKDYSPEQIEVWTEGTANTERWAKRISEQHFYLAISHHKMTGFASMTNDGYVDLLYVHYVHQGRKIGSLLLRTLEDIAERLKLNEIRADVSITARPFFEKHGFIMIKTQRKEVKGVSFTNFLMTKQLPSGTE